MTASACATPSPSSSPLSSVPAPTQLDIADRGIGIDPQTRWCDQEAPPVEASAPTAIASGVNALAALVSDPPALRERIRSDVQARIERAAFLHV